MAPLIINEPHIPVCDGQYLRYRDSARACELAVDSATWFGWLAASANRTFAYNSPGGSFTARREQRRGSEYWYAYRKVSGRLRRVYLGKSEALTGARLAAAAERLIHSPTPPTAPASAQAQRALTLPPPESERPPGPPPTLDVPRNAVSTRARSTLPVPLTSFIGRETELAAITGLLLAAPPAGVRLLTLTGPGGCGKTRLAMRAAHAVEPLVPDGVYLVELAALSDPALVAHAVGGVLGVREEVNQSMLITLRTTLQSRQALLVLDNCEHLIAACAQIVESLLQGCPRLRVLATSREALGISGETVRRVPSLTVPPSDPVPPEPELAAYEAVQLFVERAAAVQPSFAITPAIAPLLVQLCRQLDGIPLALELAAARLPVLTLDQIVQRLDDRFRLLTGGSRTALPRHRTLRATLDWSYDLLTEPERTLLRRLSVFAGGWSLEAAEAVAGGRGSGVGGLAFPRPDPRTAGEDRGDGASALLPTPDDTLDTLTALVAKSLVQVEDQGNEARYHLLETVRQYAWERLRSAGEEAATRERHQAWCLGLIEQAAPQLTGPEQSTWLRRLATEHDNLRTALNWTLERGGADLGLRLAGGMWRFWYIRGHLSEGRRWLEAGLTRDDSAPAVLRARALTGAGWLARAQGDLVQAIACYEAALALRRQLGDRREIAEALNDLAMTLCEARDYTRAAALHKESLALFRQVGETRGIAMALTNLGRVMNDRGDYARAVALHEEALSLFRRLGDTANIAYTLENLQVPVTELGDYGRSNALLDECLAVRRELGDTGGMAMTLMSMGRVALYQGEYQRAQALLEQSLALRRALGMTRRIANPLTRLAMTLRAQGQVARAVIHFRESLTLLREAGDRRGLALCLEEVAQVAAVAGQSAQAARLLGAAAAIRDAIGAPRERADRPTLDATVAALRAALGEIGLDSAWMAGRALSTEQAVAEALTVSPPTSPPLPARPPIPAPTEPPAPAADPIRLTPREIMVLRQIAAGRSSQEIAADLGISVRTIERHITNLYGKLEVRNRAEATLFALRHGLA